MYPENGNRNGHKSEAHLHTGGLIDELHDFFIDIGVRAERSGALPLALDLYEAAVRRKPNSALAWYNFGDALLALKRFDEAVIALRKAVELSPKTTLFQMFWAWRFTNWVAMRKPAKSSPPSSPVIPTQTGVLGFVSVLDDESRIVSG